MKPKKIESKSYRKKLLKPLLYLFELLKLAGIAWQKRDSSTQGAAITCYAIFSVAPLLLFSVVLIGWWFGEDAARGQIVEKIEWLVGSDGAAVIQSVIQQGRDKNQSLPILLGSGVMLFGASGMFVQFQSALNKIWGEKPPRKHALLGLIERRLVSCLIVFAIGLLVLSSLVLTIWFSAANQLIYRHLGELGMGSPLFSPVIFVNTGVSLLMFVVMFALIFKCLPDYPPRWKDVWVGAVATSVLFLIVKQIIGSYLGKTLLGSSFGAAQSLTALTAWIYLSSLIVLYGAEIIHANDILRKERRLARKLFKIEEMRNLKKARHSQDHASMEKTLKELHSQTGQDKKDLK